MNKRSQTSRDKTRAKQQLISPPRRSTYALLFVCILTLICGFFFAAHQHFSSMDYGMKNSRLRKQVDELEAEKRRLLLAREISLSPSEIKKAAKRTGLTTAAGGDAVVAQLASLTMDKAIPPKISDAKSMIIMTAAVSPVQTATTAISYRKPERPGKQVKPRTSND